MHVGVSVCWCELRRCKQMGGESGQVLTVSACVHVHARGMASANTSRQCHSQDMKLTRKVALSNRSTSSASKMTAKLSRLASNCSTLGISRYTMADHA